MAYLANLDNPLHKDHSKSSRHPIQVSLDSDGCPILPGITMNELNNPYMTKDVQTMLSDYMCTHISMSYSHYQMAICNIYAVGYVTGKPKLTIPWGKLIQDPSSWIKKECYPKDFQWKHPSKIKINDVFHLIYYWRDHRSQEQDALIWVTTSKLFDDAHRPSRQARSLQRSPVQVESSDEERFILSRSSEIDEDEGSCHRRVHLLGFLVILPKSLI